MPTYTFRRPTDGAVTQQKLSFQQYDGLRAGLLTVTDEEGTVLDLVFNPATANFVLKDGPSGGWMSKALKEKNYRSGRDIVMAQRERDHVFKTRLIPNLNGVEGHNWKDVQEEVRSKKGILSASTFDAHVAKEKTGL